MGKRNRKRNKNQSNAGKAETKIIVSDKEKPSVDKKDDLEKEILSEIQDKKNNPASENKNEKSDLLSEIVEDIKKESAKEAVETENKDSDKEETDKQEADKEQIDKEKADKKKTDKKETHKEKADIEKTETDKEKADIEETDKKETDKEKADKKETDKKETDKEQKGKKERNKKKTDKDKTEKKDEAAAAVALDMPIPFIDPNVARYKKKKKTAKLVWIISVSAVAAVYICGLIISSMFFYSNTKINGINVSGKNVTEAEKLIVADMNTYTLEVNFSNCTETIKVGDGGLSLSLAESVKDIKKKQKPYLWFMHFGKTYEYDVQFVASFNDSEMSEFLMSYDAMKKENMTKSKNAKVELSSGVAQIIPDETGTELDTDSVCDVVEKALTNCDASVDIAGAGCYVEADIKADSPSIVNGYSAAEEFLSIDAAYDFAGYRISIPKEELAAMAYLDESGNLKISKEKVYEYAAKFAAQYTTAGTERKFKTHDGDIIGIYGQYYGWIIDEEKEAEELYDLICKKESFTKEPACEKTGYAMGEMNDIGDTYIEIDLTNQHLYYYVDGKLVLDNDIVSGWLYNPNNYKTPGGLFAMDNKAYKVDLVGENYRTPVNYWMGFNGGIGIHDATWRSKFGGDIYKYDGSHGCINLPLSFAAQVYEIAEPGMPVLCYWLDEVTFYNE